MNKLLALGLASFVLLATSAMAENEIRQETVQFQPGKSSASLTGRIKGYESTDYLLAARAGQTMEVTLRPRNRFTYFNIMPPGEDSALFIGSITGNHFSGPLPKDGSYTVRVYLMRNAARRNESGDYSIDFKITDSSSDKKPGH